MNNETTDGGATVPCISLLGISVHHKEDGCWIVFKASNGREACVNLTVYAESRGGIVGSAIRQWIEDVRPNAPREGSAVARTLDADVGTRTKKGGV